MLLRIVRGRPVPGLVPDLVIHNFKRKAVINLLRIVRVRPVPGLVPPISLVR
jgi:hypothetical protein